MKKALITLMLFGGIATAATELRYWAGNEGHDLTEIEDGSTLWLGVADGTKGADASVVTSITTQGNTDYSLVFYAAEAVHFAVNDDLYFNQIYSADDTKVGSYTIDFGSTGSITAATDYNGWGGAIRFTQSAAVTLNVEVLGSQIHPLAHGELFTRTLISTPLTTAANVTGMWNVTNNMTINLTGDVLGLSGYTWMGAVSDVNALQAGQFGYTNSYGDTVALVVCVPEPSTATLSLLALTGLATRRRRK